jgi:prolyl-tRNA editing enzyme YbaK/EbsC (Cys-tRNA(Pro) deacylase)
VPERRTRGAHAVCSDFLLGRGAGGSCRPNINREARKRLARKPKCRIRTEYISREWKVLPAQVAKTLTLRVGEDRIIGVTCGDSRLDNRKVKEELGGKGHMMPGSEAAESTGHPVGAITPLCLASVLPGFFDIRLKRFEEVVTAGGSTHAAIRIPLTRFAQLTGATWVDVCKEM